MKNHPQSRPKVVSSNAPWHISLQANLIENEISKQTLQITPRAYAGGSFKTPSNRTAIVREAKGPITGGATFINQFNTDAEEIGERERFKELMRTK